MNDSKSASARATSVDFGRGDAIATTSSSSASAPRNAFQHGVPELTHQQDDEYEQNHGHNKVHTSSADAVERNNTIDDPKRKKTWAEKLAYFKTRDFWTILALGQFLAICVTGTNTLTTLLVNEGTSIPAFQSFFNYVLLNAIYTGYTIYKYGFKKWGNLLLKDGWKCMC